MHNDFTALAGPGRERSERNGTTSRSLAYFAIAIVFSGNQDRRPRDLRRHMYVLLLIIPVLVAACWMIIAISTSARLRFYRFFALLRLLL